MWRVLTAKLEELSKAKFGELADRMVAANDQKQKYLEKLDEYITHENRLAAWHAAEQKKVDRWAATYDRMIADVRKYRDEEKELLSAAKKRARDSCSVESTIVRKLVKRCHQCSLCHVCAHTHEQYRKSKYGDGSF